MNVDKLLEALDNEDNEDMIDSTTENIKEAIQHAIGELDLDKETSKTMIKKPQTSNYLKKRDQQIYYTNNKPIKNKKGNIVFKGYRKFRPNLTPFEVIKMGSFGGTYFRPIESFVTFIF